MELIKCMQWEQNIESACNENKTLCNINHTGLHCNTGLVYHKACLKIMLQWFFDILASFFSKMKSKLAKKKKQQGIVK